MSLKHNKKLMVFPSDQFGCGYYRLILPYTKLQEQGYNIEISYSGFQGKYEDADKDYDISHFQRVVSMRGLIALKKAKKKGPVIMDLDDDLFHLYPGHPNASYFRKGKMCLNCNNPHIQLSATVCPQCKSTSLMVEDRIAIAAEAIRMVDYVTVSTPELYEEFKHVAKNIGVFPNYVDIKLYENLVPKPENYLTVGWAGSFTHTIDLADLSAGLPVLNEFPNAFFATCGDPDIQKAIHHAIPEGKIIDLHPVSTVMYPELIANFDIGLAPIVDNKFNRGKSALKVTEYGAAGIPSIASDVAPYSRYIEHGVTGFLVKKPKEWGKYIRLLLSDADLRHSMAAAAKKQAWDTMDVNKNLGQRIELLDSFWEA